MWFECRVCKVHYQAHDNNNSVKPGLCKEHRKADLPPIPRYKLECVPVKLHSEYRKPHPFLIGLRAAAVG